MTAAVVAFLIIMGLAAAFAGAGAVVAVVAEIVRWRAGR